MNMRSPIKKMLTVFALALAATACTETREARQVEMSVASDPSGVVAPFENDLGYQIEVTTMRAVVDGLRFTTDGEAHGSSQTVGALEGAGRWLASLLVSEAHAHPGHEADGMVVGELTSGRVVVTLSAPNPVGTATLLESRYQGANLVFGVASAARDALAADDALIGHTLELAGTATRDGVTYDFVAYIAQDEGRTVTGLPMSLDLRDGRSARGRTLGLQATLVDPIEHDTAFDGLDFAVIDAADATPRDRQVRIDRDSGEPHHRLRNKLQAHDHWQITVLEAP